MLQFALPAFLLGLLLVPVVVWLHFVRQARRSRKVSALWLWPAEFAPASRAKFSSTWLLLLQLLAVVAACLAAAGPRFSTTGRDLVLIVDASAEMDATDLAPSRLGVALREANALLSGAGQTLLVRAGLQASVLAGPNHDLGALRQALMNVQAGDSSTDFPAALRLAQSLLPQALVHVFSSHPAPAGFVGVWHRVLGNGANVGIVAFALRGPQAFVALESNLNAPKQVLVQLERDGKNIAQSILSVPSGARATWLPKINPVPGQYQVRLEGQAGQIYADALKLDDRAFAVINVGRVLVSPPQADVLKAVVSVPGVSVVSQDTPPNSSNGFAAMVLVGSQPVRLPAGNYVVFAPPASQVKASGRGASSDQAGAGRANPDSQRNPAISDQPVTVSSWDATAPELRFVSLDGLRARISAFFPPAIDGTWTVLAKAANKPFVQRGEGEGLRALYISAHPSETDLRNSPALPVMLFNFLTEALNSKSLPLGSFLAAERVLEPGVHPIGVGAVVVHNLFSAATRFERGASGVETLGEKSSRVSMTKPSDDPDSAWRNGLLMVALLALLLEAWLRAGARWPSLAKQNSRPA